MLQGESSQAEENELLGEFVLDGLREAARGEVKIEVALSDDLVERAIEAIIDAAKTGKVGDGKIFVTALEQVHRIRTGETGDQAI